MKLSTHVLAILGLAVAFWSVGCGAESVEPPISVAKQPDHYEHGIGRIFDGAATASIEERSFLADTIVKARFVSAGDGVLRFQSIQYLKGTGPTKFSVKAETEGRDTRWDNQDAVLFLVLLTGESEDFKFLDSTTWHYLDEQFVATGYAGALPEGYTLGTQNPVWLPVTSSSSTSSTQVRASVGASSGKTIITEYEASGALAIVTETELQKTISWASAGPPKNAGGGAATTRNNAEESYVANFANCVGASLMQIRHERDWEAYYGVSRFPGQIDREMKAGIGRGVVVDSTSHYRPYRGIRFNRVELDGQDANLFEVRFIDDDNNPLNTDSDLLGSYAHEVLTRRPLPAGDYTYNVLTYLYFLEPCGFRNTKQEKLNTGFYVVFNVTATTSADVVHEAFFDPATTTAGVGYLAGSATTTGVLEPAGFSVRGRAIAITGLTWQNGRVVLTLDRFGSWLDGFSFIEPDGTVGLRLAEVDATKDWTARTLTWEVSEQPWEPGDELMMRMGPIPLPAVRNLTAEANSAGEVVLRWEVAYRAWVSGYRIWRHRPGRDEGPRIYVSDTLSTDTTYTDANSLVPNLTEYRVQAIDRVYNAGESSESVRVGSQ